MKNKRKYSQISVIIPTYNNELDIESCLLSITYQKYPKTKVEILVCDGGSIDDTMTIAKKYGCKIYKNEKRLAEYGVSLGLQKAKGEFIVVMAADNEFANVNYFSHIIDAFNSDKNIMFVYTNHMSGIGDSWIADYINNFTDPFNHFVYGMAANPQYFRREYPIKKETPHWIIYTFQPTDYPLIAFAQGIAVRATFKRGEETYGDDLSPVINMIEKGYDLAYLPNSAIIHHTTRTLKEFIRKTRWAVDNYLTEKKYGLNIREGYFSKKRKLRKIMWPLYASLIIPPVIRSVIGLIQDRKRAWLYHPLLTYIVFFTIVFEVIRIKIFHNTGIIERKNVTV